MPRSLREKPLAQIAYETALGDASRTPYNAWHRQDNAHKAYWGRIVEAVLAEQRKREYWKMVDEAFGSIEGG